VIRALDLFFNNGGNISKCQPHVRRNPDSAHRRKRYTILITLWFADLPAALKEKYDSYIAPSGELPVRLRFNPRNDALQYLLFSKGVVKNGVSDGRPSNTILGDITEYINLRVIPESRDIRREFRTELGEAFAKLKESVIESAHGRAAKASADLYDALDEILDRELTKRLNANLGEVIPDHTFKVGSIKKTEFARVVMQEAFSRYPMCAHSPDCLDGDGFDLEEIGAGFQSNVLIALHRTVAALERKKLILCVEEPEIHLDPNAQRRAYHEWKKLSYEEDEVDQILINTHSAFIVNEAAPEEIVVVRRDERRRTTCSQLTGAFLQCQDIIQLKTKVLGLRNSDIFFSNGIVLVEGDSDAVAVRGCFDLLLRDRPIQGKTSLSALGVSVIDCGGKGSIAPLARVVRELGIPCVSVYDRDFLQKCSRHGGVRVFLPEIDREFDALKNFFPTPIAFASCKAYIGPRLTEGIPSNYPRGINEKLGEHGILIMRTELETDFIDERTAIHVASVVNCRRSQEESLADLVIKLKTELYRNQLKRANVTAKVLCLMKESRELPRVYVSLCHDILKSLRLKPASPSVKRPKGRKPLIHVRRDKATKLRGGVRGVIAARTGN
jgi:hypothetical protein